MKKAAIILLVGWISMLCVNGQYADHQLPQYPESWNSQWITHPHIDPSAYGLIHFRNFIDLEEKPESFIVHVSGDNRYRLYVNGHEVCYGPQLGDFRHWRYESIDLAPYLKEGGNIVAVEVMNWGIERSYGIISFKTGFLLQGHGEKESILNTGYESGWKVCRNEALFEKTVYWRTSGEIVGGFYAANPTDSLVAGKYPWGWKQADFDDSHWESPEVIFARPKTDAGAGHGWILQPRTTAIQESRKEEFTRIARSDLDGVGPEFNFGKEALEIPANSTNSLLIDQGYVTLGYPVLHLSGGKGSLVKIRYSEALYDEQNMKGNRNKTDGKVVKGISDVYLADGGKSRSYQPIWFRAFRFIQLDITTGDEPLRIDDYYNVYSAASFPVKASFKTDDHIYQEIWDLCWHSMKICAQDNLLSDVYYEQMQYVGDLRPHLKSWTALTGDLSYFQSAMEQFNNSRLPDGNITSCYPLKATFVHPTYSLMWIDMLHDLMMLEGNKALLESYLGEIDEVFGYYESLINKNGLVGKSKYLMFVDWYVPKAGNSRVNKDGNSAILSLNYAYSLQKAAEILDWLGQPEKAGEYQNRSARLAENVKNLCFDEKKGIYADDPEKTFYDQRASILAVLCGAHGASGSRELMERLLDPGISYDSEANLFYYFYLFEAMKLTGRGDFTALLQPWKDVVDMGMSGTPEKKLEQNPRSEIHPWASHPVHYYFSVVAGIQARSPGYKTVRIAPNPGELGSLDASLPTIQGNINVRFNFGENGQLEGHVELPPGVGGILDWKGESRELGPGKNEVYLDIKKL